MSKGWCAFQCHQVVVHMRLQALLLTPDEKIERVLRRVLGDLEISVEYCADTDSALNKLTRDRFEAVIVDCDDDETAARVLKSVRATMRNKRAVAVAIIDSQKRVRGAFELGAHFVLYKPISAERAKTSFRAARALMKRERRRNTRIPIEIPVQLTFAGGAGGVKAKTSDLGEGGIAINVSQRLESGAALGNSVLSCLIQNQGLKRGERSRGLMPDAPPAFALPKSRPRRRTRSSVGWIARRQIWTPTTPRFRAVLPI